MNMTVFWTAILLAGLFAAGCVGIEEDGNATGNQADLSGQWTQAAAVECAGTLDPDALPRNPLTTVLAESRHVTIEREGETVTIRYDSSAVVFTLNDGELVPRESSAWTFDLSERTDPAYP